MGPATYVVERQLRIDAPVDRVAERVVDLHRWQAWSPWEDVDPHLRRTYEGPSSGVGATYRWQGNRKAGTGRMEITGVDRDAGGTTVTIDLRFVKPFKSSSTTTFRLRPDGDGTVVTWTMTGPKTVATRVMGVLWPMDKVVGPDFEKGLARLKVDAEAG